MKVFLYTSINDVHEYDNKIDVTKQKTTSRIAEYFNHIAPLKINSNGFIKIEDEEFEIFTCVNDFAHETQGYIILNIEDDFTEEPITTYYEKNYFSLYFNKSKSIGLMNTSSKNAFSFIKRIKKLNKFNPIAIDLTSKLPDIQHISGLTLQKVNDKNVKTLIINGPSPDSSNVYKDHKDSEISTIRFHYTFKGIIHTILLTKKGAFVFYTKAPSEDYLELCLVLIKQLSI